MTDSWRSKLNTKYNKDDIDKWDVKLKAELKALKLQAENKKCFDCGVEDVSWASPKLGIFICVTCSDVHRAAGAHITCVKNFNTYLWGPDEVTLMTAVGNRRGRELYGKEVVSPGADKNAKVAYCTRKYGNSDVQQLVAKKIADAKATAETTLDSARKLPRSEQAKAQDSIPQNFFDDFFSEPPVANKSAVGGYRASLQPALKVDRSAAAAAPARPVLQDIGSESRVRGALAVVNSTENKHGSLDEFLAECNPAIKTATHVDLFEGLV